MNDLRFRGTLFAKLGKFGSVVERWFDEPWTLEGVRAAFGEHVVECKDDQQLWSSARYQEGANRGNAGLVCNHGVVLDRDCADVGELDSTRAHLRKLGLAYVLYTSWSHGKAEKQHEPQLPGRKGPFDCFRVVLPYERDLAPDEHRALVQGLYGHEVPLDPPHYAQEVLGRFVTLPSGRERAARPRGWDPVASRPSQGYYTPTPWALLEVEPGEPLRVAAVLQRPTTPRVTSRRSRPYQPPTREASGALGVMAKALERHSFGLGPSNPDGWARSVCPSCQDPSPSLTARANGDGIELRCHAGCARREILDAVGLDAASFRAPTDLRIALDEQLERQAPADDDVSADEAGELLERDINEAFDSGEPTVIRYPAGTGKAFAPRGQ